jgi:hypothetical protein
MAELTRECSRFKVWVFHEPVRNQDEGCDKVDGGKPLAKSMSHR